MAAFEWIAAQVVAVQFDEVEGVQEDVVVMAVVANEIKRRHAVVVAGDCLAVTAIGSWLAGTLPASVY